MPLLIPPKKMDAIIMGMSNRKPSGERVEESATSERDYDIALEAACEDIFKAIESKNTKLLCDAMKDFHSIYDEEMEAEGFGAEEEEHETY